MLDSDTRPRRVAIIGGGITGLAAAHRLGELSPGRGRPVDVTLFEASPRLGGVFGTQTIDGFTIETGADSFITNKPWALDLCQRLNLTDQLISTDSRFRRSLILKDGRPVATPQGFELIVPRRFGPLLWSPLLSRRGKLRVASEFFIPARRDDADESLGSFVRRRLGPEALERIVQPMVGGIYTSDPERLSMQATLPRFLAMERDHGSLLKAVLRERHRSSAGDQAASGARYGLFASLAGGLSLLVDTLHQQLQSRGTIQLQRSVDAVRPIDTGWTLRTSSGEALTFDALIVAVPAYRAASLIESWDADLAGRLQAIEYASSAIVVTGHRLADIRHPLDAFGLVIPHVEGRRILAVSFLSRKFPSRAPEGQVILRTFVGGAMQPEQLECTDDELVQLVRSELQELLGVQGYPLVSLVARYDRGMPQYHVGHLDRVASIETAAARHAGFQLAGNAYHGVGLPDCIHSGERAAEAVFAHLQA